MADWYTLWEGIQLCIALQLVVIGAVKLFSKKTIEIILGVLCLIVASYFFKTIFFQFIDNHLLLSLFLSGALFFYYGPLLYLYLALIEKSRSLSFFIRHLIAPTFFFIVYASLRTFFKAFFDEYALYVNLTALFTSTIWIGYYFYLGIQVFKHKLNKSLLLKARKKFKFFYYAINIFILNEFISATLSFIASTTDISIFRFIDNYYIHYFAKYIHVPIYVLLSLYMLLYALSQSNRYKSFFLGHKLHIDQDLIDGKILIEQRIQLHFHQNKVYKNPDLKLADASAKIGVTTSMFTEYLKNEYDSTFTDFINKLRIEEFKRQLKEPGSKNFSLLGLAQESGFKSKATFYRVFKKREGITPSEYQKSL